MNASPEYLAYVERRQTRFEMSFIRTNSRYRVRTSDLNREVRMENFVGRNRTLRRGDYIDKNNVYIPSNTTIIPKL